MTKRSVIRQRLAKLRKRIEAEKLDAFVVSDSRRYFGLQAGHLIVPQDAPPLVVGGRIDFELLRRSPFRFRLYSEVKVPCRQEERPFIGEPWRFYVEIFRELRVKYVGFERISLPLLRKICAEGCECVEVPDLVRELRAVKSPEELDLLREAASIAGEGMRVASELIEAGRTEREIAAEVEYEMRKRGSEGAPFPTIVASGPNSWIPHARPTQRRLRKGEHVVVDLGATVDGYVSDMTRTFLVGGGESKLMRKVRQVQEQVKSQVREGVKASELDGLARRAFKKDAKFFNHGLGHGVGLEIHELPSLNPSSGDVLRAGMVITVEPGLYVPGKGGARWEDMLLVKKAGYEQLT